MILSGCAPLGFSTFPGSLALDAPTLGTACLSPLSLSLQGESVGSSALVDVKE